MKPLIVSDLVIYVVIFKKTNDFGLFCVRSVAKSRHVAGEGQRSGQFS